jgi:broad specificity phosphatase PhoE
MVARQVHLVRHGEVFNPDRVLYGRLPNFGLSDRGALMAEAAAAHIAAAHVIHGVGGSMCARNPG